MSIKIRVLLFVIAAVCTMSYFAVGQERINFRESSAMMGITFSEEVSVFAQAEITTDDIFSVSYRLTQSINESPFNHISNRFRFHISPNTKMSTVITLNIHDDIFDSYHRPNFDESYLGIEIRVKGRKDHASTDYSKKGTRDQGKFTIY